MRNPDVLFVLTRRTAADDVRRELSIVADVIFIESVPDFGSKRRYRRIFFQYPDEAWLDMKGYFGSEISGFERDYFAELNSWLVPGGSVTYI